MGRVAMYRVDTSLKNVAKGVMARFHFFECLLLLPAFRTAFLFASSQIRAMYPSRSSPVQVFSLMYLGIFSSEVNKASEIFAAPAVACSSVNIFFLSVVGYSGCLPLSSRNIAHSRPHVKRKVASNANYLLCYLTEFTHVFILFAHTERGIL